MFTGIIQQQGRVEAVETIPAGRRLRLRPRRPLERAVPGASMAVNGVCLTLTDAADPEQISFEVIPETLRCTTLGSLEVGDHVNLEPALAVGDRLDGHMVAGHVDGTAELIERTDPGVTGEVIQRFALAAALTDQMIHKGSVALDGVSMTLAELKPGRLAVALIPMTLTITTLGPLSVGERVNLEVDMIGKWITRMIPQHLVARPGAAS